MVPEVNNKIQQTNRQLQKYWFWKNIYAVYSYSYVTVAHFLQINTSNSMYKLQTYTFNMWIIS